MIARWGSMAALLALVVASYWLVAELGKDDDGNNGDDRHVADLYVTNFSTVTMGEDGSPARELQAVQLAHFPDTGTKELEAPYIVLHHPDRPPLHARSERGWVSANDDVMLLLGAVHIWREDADGVRELDVKTTDLRVLPETQYGETDKLVVIRTPNSESRGVGMRAYLSQQRIELLSRVRTVYEQKIP